MVTVTFPARAAAAPPPDRPMPVPAEGEGGFETLFALLQPPAEAADEEVVPGIEATADTPELAEEMEKLTDDGEEQTLPTYLIAALLSGPDPAIGPQVAPGQPLAQLLITAAAMVVPTEDLGDQTPPPVAAPGTDSSDVIPVPSSTTASAPPLSPVPPANMAPSLPPALPVSDQPAQGPEGSGDPPATGLFLQVDTAAAPQRSAGSSSGVPAFWAAREAAESAPSLLTDTPDPAAPPELPKHALAAMAAPPSVDPEAPVDDGTSVPLVTEGRTVLGQPFVQGASWTQAPVPSAPQSTPAPTMPPHVPHQIAALIASRAERPLELRLAPVELGGLTLNLRNDGDMLRVVLQADRPETLDLLRRNGDLLLEELRLAGFAGASLSFGDGGGAQDRGTPPSGTSASGLDLSSPPPRTPLSAFAPQQAAQGLHLRL